MLIRRSIRLLACLLLLPLLSAADKPARDDRRLRVMSYNIHIAKGMDGKIDLPRIAKVIKDADVDVVALQEVDAKTKRSGVEVDQLKELAKLTGMHGKFGKARDFDGGAYGQAVLSRKPIEKMEIHELPGAADAEQRVALLTTIPQPKPLPDLLFVATHLHHQGEEHRLKQSKDLTQLLAPHMNKHNPALMVLGDLNAKPDSETMHGLLEKWDDATKDAGMTFPANKPDRKIDYVLLPKGHPWEVVSAKVVDEPVASDHRPVVVELKWKGDR